MESAIPKSYQYFNILKEHLKGDLRQIFNKQLIYPRQLEIQLPGDHKQSCNFKCSYCQGKLMKKSLANYEEKALNLIDQLKGRIPFIVYSGVYTEPLLNSFMLQFIEKTKMNNSNYGIHTNGSLLEKLEQNGFLSKIFSISDSSKDYISISLDAGRAESHSRIKNLNENYFDKIIRGIKKAVSIRKDSGKPAIRICYLLNDYNSSKEEIKGIIEIMKEIKVDSLRFSIPYETYGKRFSKVREHEKKIEIPQHKIVQNTLNSLMSKDKEEKPFVFYIPPCAQSIEKMKLNQCIYGYYQITFGADGFVYRCSSTSAPNFSMNRLGEIPDSLEKLEDMMKTNQDSEFRPSTCFSANARCCRQALELNNTWKNTVIDSQKYL